MNPKLPLFHKAENSINFENKNRLRESYRLYVIPIVFLVTILALFTRLFQLTIVKGAYYRDVAENNRIRELSIDGQRGSILDTNGSVIARTILIQARNDSEFDTFKREYSFGESVGGIIGYRQKASPEDFKADACEYQLSLNDKTGKAGVESLYECHLRQKKGKKLIEVDAMGKYLKTMSEIDPIDGKSVRLSLNADLQEKMYERIQKGEIVTDPPEFNEKHIALVALKPQTGEIISLISYPGFDPQDFEDERTDKVQAYFKDKDKPLYNKALQGAYPPGSVFKPIMAVGALEEKVVSPTDTFTDKGFIESGGSRFHNWLYTKYGRTDGEVDMYKGLQRSNDIYFYRLGEELHLDNIKKWSEKFGLGQKSRIDLPDVAGTVPSDFWKREHIGDRWYLGDTYNLSIGQGYLLTTPMQMTRATAVIANGGKLCKPQLLKLDAFENRLLLNSSKPECEDVSISPETIEVVKEGMKRVCEPLGTAWPFFEFKVNGTKMEVGCKTGTAQSVGEDKDPHAWFTIFAPFESPEVVLTVMVENGGEGSNVAAPIAKEFLTLYFGN